ncbi:uncharacterized protein LOC119328290 isoform X2 [Triticum dicoccoides]|uniref:uncharacterized protein LOC119328290 isoform X2 n=1 Tax=Triticum dicoccoides TaxID=85692 RepID=UPI00189106D0|nr:uncharacterized protein LOC119328290 isoform X2 [Triticum dicoccoides]
MTNNKNDDILGNFLTNKFLTDLFSLELSRKVMTIIEPPDQSGAGIASDILNNMQPKGDTIAPQDQIEQAQKKVQQALKKKRYIVLITGLGEAATWDNIEKAFPDGGNGRVIITTYRWDVALKCSSGQSDLIYRSGSWSCTKAPDVVVDDKAQMEIKYVEELRLSDDNQRACVFSLSTVQDANEFVFEKESMVRKWNAEGFTSADEDLFDKLVNKRWIIQQGSGPTYKLDTKFLSGLRKEQRTLMTGKSFELPPGWNSGSSSLSGIALVDILVCQLNDKDLDKLGQMKYLRNLVLEIAGIPTKVMVITKGSFPQLQVFELNCHVPWVTFEDGAMPELRCLRFKLYAGPKGKTPSGTNHLKKLDELSLNYGTAYNGSPCVLETTSTMEEEAEKRAKPTTLITNNTAKFPKLRVTNYDNMKELVLWARKITLFLFHCVLTPLFPLAHHFRGALAKMTTGKLLFVIPLLALICYHNIILLAWIAPWALMLASWLARRVLPILMLFAIKRKLAGDKSPWQKIIVPVLAYKMVGLVVAIYPSLSKAILVSYTTLVWSVCALLRILLLYILTPLWYTISTLLIYAIPVICALVLSIYLVCKTKKVPLGILPVLALPFYFFPSQSYSAVLWSSYGVTEWLIWGI